MFVSLSLSLYIYIYICIQRERERERGIIPPAPPEVRAPVEDPVLHLRVALNIA